MAVDQELPRRDIPEGLVRPDRAVVLNPAVGDLANLLETGEDQGVEHRLGVAAIEAC